MFNNIPTSALETGGTSVGTQVALWIAVVGVIGAGVYFFATSGNDDSQQLSNQKQTTVEQPPVAVPDNESSQQGEETTTSPDEKTSSPPENAPAADDDKESETAAPSNESNDAEPSKGPAPIDVFDPTEENKEPSRRESPSSVSESTPLHESSIAVELDSNNKRYDFHYQFKDGKLFLYGAFERNLYEIMEFFSDNKRTVFLFYKDNYYLLNEENDAVKPLTPISDPLLLKKLKDYRGTR
jgi:hypothetical protein